MAGQLPCKQQAAGSIPVTSFHFLVVQSEGQQPSKLYGVGSNPTGEVGM